MGREAPGNGHSFEAVATVIVKSIKINNLRNIRTADIVADPTLNLLIGDNGAGKTSVLEALMVLAKGKSFRTGQIGALIGPEGDSFLVSAVIEHRDGQRTGLGIERSTTHWRARRDGQDCRQIGELSEALPLVLLEPNSHQLIAGPPEERRRYLDWTAFHVEHGYLALWRRYARAVRQRNAALRAKDLRLVESLDPVLADLGQEVHQQRSARASQLHGLLRDQWRSLGPDMPEIGLRYQKGWAGDDLRAALKDTCDRDMARGATSSGPHRGDLLFVAGGHPAREALSRGEQKLLAAALLLSQAQTMIESGAKPALLLDDLASEFDGRNRAAVLQASLQLGLQTWVTGTSLESLAVGNRQAYSLFHVEHGDISDAGGR